MSDHIHIRVEEEMRDMLRIFADELIAFFPDEGFLAFEGYGMIPADQLPCMVTVWRSKQDWKNGGTIDGELFQLRITASYKKDVQEPKEARANQKDHDCDDPIECGCGIQFFPRDLILYRFDVVSCRDKTGHDFRYSIDDRFDTADALIQAYVGLMDLPADPYESYMSRKEDYEFYRGYYHCKKRGRNIYLKGQEQEQEQDQEQDQEQEPSLQRGKTAEMSEKEKNHPHQYILDTLNGWFDTKGKTTRWTDHPKGNKTTLAHIEAVLSQVEASLPMLQAWCAEYLSSMSAKDQLRAWLQYGIQNREVSGRMGWWEYPLSHQPIGFETHWKLFFRKERAEADMILLGGKEFDISYPHYLSLLSRLHREWWSSTYDEPSVVAIHEGKPCNHDMCCFLCEERTDAWHKHLLTKYRSMNNIFINQSCGEEFASLWLDSVDRMSKGEQAQIHWVWPPPFTFVKFNRDDNESVVGLSLDAFIAYLVDARYRSYYVYPKRIFVEFEFVHLLEGSLAYYKVPTFDTREEYRWNEVFLFVSGFVLYAPYMLYADKKLCRETIAMYEPLPDD